MRIAIWTVFGLVALLWTGGAFVVSELTQWAARVLASGEAAALGKEVAQWPVPQWISPWMDPALLQSMQAALLWLLELLHDVLPLFDTAAVWLVPMVWVLWGLGLAAMLLLAGGAHLLSGRLPWLRPRRT